MEVIMLEHTNDPEYVIERAYLACRNIVGVPGFSRKMYDKETHERIERMFKDGHFGLLEHAQASFLVKGISRSCTHQLVRHRIASYAQLSMRAVEPDKVGYITPKSYPDWAKIEYAEKYDELMDFYNRMVADGVPLEDARMCCYIGTETQIIITMNFRSWIHFLKLRTSSKAQWEIKELADEIWEQLKGIAPNVFDGKYKGFWE